MSIYKKSLLTRRSSRRTKVKRTRLYKLKQSQGKESLKPNTSDQESEVVVEHTDVKESKVAVLAAIISDLECKGLKVYLQPPGNLSSKAILNVDNSVKRLATFLTFIYFEIGGHNKFDGTMTLSWYVKMVRDRHDLLRKFCEVIFIDAAPATVLVHLAGISKFTK